MDKYLHQISSWKNILAGVLQGSVLELLLFLIYINDLPDGLTLLCKIFVDDTSLFSKAVYMKKSEIEPNKNLKLMGIWANGHVSGKCYLIQAIEVCFSHKHDNVPPEPLTFNNNKIQSAPAQKHLRLTLAFISIRRFTIAAS